MYLQIHMSILIEDPSEGSVNYHVKHRHILMVLIFSLTDEHGRTIKVPYHNTQKYELHYLTKHKLFSYRGNKPKRYRSNTGGHSHLISPL